MSNDVMAQLRKKAEQVRHGAAMISEEIMDWQVIKVYMCNRLEGIELTPKQKIKFDRYQFIYNQSVGGKYTKQEIISQLTRIYEIDVRQAYNDINAAQEIFPAFININKKFELMVELESARNMKRKCEQLQDFKTAAMIGKNIIAILDLMPDEESKVDDFEGITLEAVFDPRLLGAPPITAADMKGLMDDINAKRNVKIKTDMFTELEIIN